MPHILDGKIVRDTILAKLKREISRLKIKPKLAIIQVGNRADSTAFIKQKMLYGSSIGADVHLIDFDVNVAQNKLLETILKLNNDHSVHGIIVQLPLPKHLDKNAILKHIDPRKDVDGLTPENGKLLLENRPEGIVPATARGIISLLAHYKIPLRGKHVVVIGRSTLVGKPVALTLLNHDATVTVCHKETKNIQAITKTADILIVAAGNPHLVDETFTHKHQIIIDVGINITSEKKIVGDVDFNTVAPHVSAITPVPGGVGPMTIASLFQNLCDAYENLTPQ